MEIQSEKSGVSEFLLLPKDVYRRINEYIGNPRDVFALLSTCRSMYSQSNSQQQQQPRHHGQHQTTKAVSDTEDYISTIIQKQEPVKSYKIYTFDKSWINAPWLAFKHWNSLMGPIYAIRLSDTLTALTTHPGDFMASMQTSSLLYNTNYLEIDLHGTVVEGSLDNYCSYIADCFYRLSFQGKSLKNDNSLKNDSHHGINSGPIILERTINYRNIDKHTPRVAEVLQQRSLSCFKISSNPNNGDTNRSRFRNLKHLCFKIKPQTVVPQFDDSQLHSFQIGLSKGKTLPENDKCKQQHILESNIEMRKDFRFLKYLDMMIDKSYYRMGIVRLQRWLDFLSGSGYETFRHDASDSDIDGNNDDDGGVTNGSNRSPNFYRRIPDISHHPNIKGIRDSDLPCGSSPPTYSKNCNSTKLFSCEHLTIHWAVNALHWISPSWNNTHSNSLELDWSLWKDPLMKNFGISTNRFFKTCMPNMKHFTLVSLFNEIETRKGRHLLPKGSKIVWFYQCLFYNFLKLHFDLLEIIELTCCLPEAIDALSTLLIHFMKSNSCSKSNHRYNFCNSLGNGRQLNGNRKIGIPNTKRTELKRLQKIILSSATIQDDNNSFRSRSARRCWLQSAEALGDSIAPLNFKMIAKSVYVVEFERS